MKLFPEGVGVDMRNAFKNKYTSSSYHYSTYYSADLIAILQQVPQILSLSPPWAMPPARSQSPQRGIPRVANGSSWHKPIKSTPGPYGC